MSSDGAMIPCKGGCGKSIRRRGNKSGLCRGCVEAGRPALASLTREQTTETRESRVVEKVVTKKVKSLEDLVRVCEIDLEEWTVERWTCGKHETAMKLETRDRYGKILKNEPRVEEAFAIKAWLVRKSPALKAHEVLKQELLADIRAEVKKGPRVPRPGRVTDGGWLFEFAPFDLHMGKYTWDEETVTNYDADIAEGLFNAALDFLLDKAMKLTGGKIDKVLCVFGNDASHIDNKRATTTMGTPMDFDSRYIRNYRKLCAIHRRAVDTLRTVAPVHVTVVPGNHDELTAFHMGEILAERYSNDRHVQVDNSAKLRKYFEYGTNLWGFAHGDAERVSELPLAMAREVPDKWARCDSREWHIGHLHIGEKWTLRSPANMVQDLSSDKGVRIRRLYSLSGHDAWHSKHAYMDRRVCESFVFHERAGFTADLAFNVDHFTGKPLLTK